MQFEWLIREGRDRLLLFFNGWGMDTRPFRDMGSGRYDVACFFDYRDPAWEFSQAVAGYRTYELAAWSMGVWAAGWNQTRLPAVARAIAINGTLRPIDPRCGIDPAAFDATLAHMARLGNRSFYNAMFSDKASYEKFYARRPERDFAGQHEELLCLRERILAEPEPAAEWTAALIASRDQIVPAKHQLHFWRGRAVVCTVRAGHFPFYLWNQWEDMLDDVARGQAPGPAAV